MSVPKASISRSSAPFLSDKNMDQLYFQSQVASSSRVQIKTNRKENISNVWIFIVNTQHGFDFKNNHKTHISTLPCAWAVQTLWDVQPTERGQD